MVIGQQLSTNDIAVNRDGRYGFDNKVIESAIQHGLNSEGYVGFAGGYCAIRRNGNSRGELLL